MAKNALPSWFKTKIKKDSAFRGLGFVTFIGKVTKKNNPINPVDPA